MYDLSAMRRAIEQCDKNIKVFEDAISQELERKMQYQRIIRELELKLAAESNK